MMSEGAEVTDEEIEKLRNARVCCFVDNEQIEGFDRAYINMLRALHKRQTSMYTSADNILRYSHGANWVRSAIEEDAGTQMQTHSAEWIIPHQSIVDNDLSLIETGLHNTVESLSAQFAQSLYRVVGEAADRVGNVVDAREAGSTAKSLLEMLKKVEFGVDREGNVTLPELHVGTGIGEKIIKELEAQPPEFSEEVERVKAERSKIALEKEAKRKAKFKAAS